MALAVAAALTPLWLDELHQLVGTYHRSIPEMIHWAQASPGGTPLNFFAQKFVLDRFGLSSIAARLPAVIFGVGSLWVFSGIARAYVKERWILATAVFALLPQIFRYGIEARPYSQGLFFALLAFRYWLALEKGPTRRTAIHYGLAVAAGLYSQVFSVFIALGQVAWSLRNPAARRLVMMAFPAACLSYLPWFFAQRATQAVAQTMSNYSFSWQQMSTLGFVRELSGGGYFCSAPLLILAFFGRDARLACLSAAGLVMPVIADATLGYFFAGRQLIFALPFLILLAAKGAAALPRPVAGGFAAVLLIASAVVDFRLATTVREDWIQPARYLADSHSCTYISPADQLPYLQIYAPQLRQCDIGASPAEILYVTTRYSPHAEPPKGYERVRSTRVGVAEIVLYRRDASLKTYGLSRFVFRP